MYVSRSTSHSCFMSRRRRRFYVTDWLEHTRLLIIDMSCLVMPRRVSLWRCSRSTSPEIHATQTTGKALAAITITHLNVIVESVIVSYFWHTAIALQPHIHFVFVWLETLTSPMTSHGWCPLFYTSILQWSRLTPKLLRREMGGLLT